MNHSTVCMTSAVVDGRLRAAKNGRARPFAPTLFDAELLSAADAAVAHSIPLAVVLPLPGTTAPLLLGAAALVGAVLKTRDLGAQVAVVSSNLRARTRYDELFFSDQRLADFMPRTSVDVHGNPHIIGRPTSDQGGRLHLVNELSRLTGWSDRLDGIVIDARAASPADLCDVLAWPLGIPIVYLTGDPTDPGLDLVRHGGGVVWGWDSSSVTALAEPAVAARGADIGAVLASPQLLRAAGSSHVTIWSPDASAASPQDDALAALWRTLIALNTAYAQAREAGPSPHGLVEAVRWVWGVFNTLALLPVSPQRFDAHVIPGPYGYLMRDVVGTARAFARNLGGPPRQAWYEVADALADALSAADRQEKLPRIEGWVTECVDISRAGVLVVRNRSAVAATTAALTESPGSPLHWQDSVKVTTLAALASGRLEGVPDEICLAGPLPRSHAGLLALPPSSRLRVVAAGPFEARRATRQAVAAGERLRDLRVETIERSASRLGVTPRSTGTLAPPAGRVSVLADGQVKPAIDTGLLIGGDSPWEPFDVDMLALLRDTVASGGTSHDDLAMVPPARTTGGTSSTVVRVIAVYLSGVLGAEVLLMEPNDLVTRRSGDTVARVAAKALVPGDFVLLVDRAARRDLLTTVLDKLSESPTYASLSALVKFWHVRAARMHDSGLTHGEIRARMYGTRITSDQSIGVWIRGEVDGPMDPEDVRRFAVAVGDSELKSEAERIGWALKTLHSVNRKVGHWLSAQLSGAQTSQAEAIIDADLDVHVSDLLESVTVHKVTAVSSAEQTAPVHVLGVAISRVEALRLVQAAS